MKASTALRLMALRTSSKVLSYLMKRLSQSRSADSGCLFEVTAFS